jgi:hypothetical protein
MSNRTWFEEPGEPIAPCDDCPDPGNCCLTRCGIQEYLKEDTADIRGETEEQLRGDRE